MLLPNEVVDEEDGGFGGVTIMVRLLTIETVLCFQISVMILLCSCVSVCGFEQTATNASRHRGLIGGKHARICTS